MGILEPRLTNHDLTFKAEGTNRGARRVLAVPVPALREVLFGGAEE